MYSQWWTHVRLNYEYKWINVRNFETYFKPWFLTLGKKKSRNARSWRHSKFLSYLTGARYVHPWWHGRCQSCNKVPVTHVQCTWSVSPSVDMLPFGVTIPATVPQRSEIPEGLTNYPAYKLSYLSAPSAAAFFIKYTPLYKLFLHDQKHSKQNYTSYVLYEAETLI